MPEIRVSTGLRLHFEEAGQGPSLLLMDGVGASWVWFKNFPFLSQNFRVVALDIRGTGRSDKPLGLYDVPTMARETVDVITGLGLGPTHLAGLSLGGQIALEAALNFPQLVAKVIPIGATPGRPLDVPPSPDTAARAIPLPFLTSEQNFLRRISAVLSPEFIRTHPGEVAIMERLDMQAPTPATSRLSIAAAVATWQGMVGRGQSLRKPVLVLGGQLDMLAPLPNAPRLASLLPNARLYIFPGSGHLCEVEQTEAFNLIVTEFLLE